MHIFLHLSHTSPDIRSRRTGQTANEVTATITDQVVTFLKRRNLNVTVCSETDEEALSQAAASSGADICISLQCHGDGAASSVGSDIFCQPQSHQSLVLAKCIMRHMVYHVNIISRGVKWSIPGDDEGTLLEHIGIPAIYVNLGFITNVHDEWLLTQRQEDYARSIGYGILEYRRYHKAYEYEP